MLELGRHIIEGVDGGIQSGKIGLCNAVPARRPALHLPPRNVQRTHQCILPNELRDEL